MTGRRTLPRRMLIRASRPPTAPVPTDRAHLLRDPRPGDDCDAWTRADYVERDCRGDGHYLCGTCRRMKWSER
jgi:hypothetical protein